MTTGGRCGTVTGMTRNALAAVILTALLAACGNSSSGQSAPPGSGFDKCDAVRHSIEREKLARAEAVGRGDSTEAAKQRQAIDLDKQVAAGQGCDVSDLTG